MMKETLLFFSMLLILSGGYFVMGRLDRFLASSLRNEPPQYQKQTPACMMLTERLSDEELIRNIRQFAARHPHISIILQEEQMEENPPGRTSGNDA